MKTLNARKRSSIKISPTKKEPISKSKFIKILFENNFDNIDNTFDNIFVEYNSLNKFRSCNFSKIFYKINFISKIAAVNIYQQK
jgi:hypothetical protein